MQLSSLEIDNFKNIRRAQLEFSPKVNGLLGNNGMGKSNLLDAIYFMSFARSFTGVNDKLLITRGELYAMIKGRYVRRGINEELIAGLSEGRRKSLKRSGKEYKKLSEHIGTFPLVTVAPADIDLIRGGSEERRRWMDMVIAQSDSLYLDMLIRYHHHLEERNALLRNGVTDHNLYAAVETTMDMAASYIHRTRSAWVQRLSGILSHHYAAIAGGQEQVELTFASSMTDCTNGLTELLNNARRKDETVKFTTVGPHRDDIEMTLDGMPMRRTASQGQCKTFTVALRLAQYEFLREATGMKPLLLLDDIFDKLDATRVERIMKVVESPDIGQIFITDTNRTHLDEIMQRTAGNYRLWEVNEGEFMPLH